MKFETFLNKINEAKEDDYYMDCLEYAKSHGYSDYDSVYDNVGVTDRLDDGGIEFTLDLSNDENETYSTFAFYIDSNGKVYDVTVSD